jgi:hypothetical protein
MIKEKVCEILDCLKEYYKLRNQAQEVNLKLIDTGKIYNQLRQDLGKIIYPLNSNIIVEKDGKLYSVFFNKKYQTAEIKKCITDKEADIQLSLKKLTQGKTKNES